MKTPKSLDNNVLSFDAYRSRKDSNVSNNSSNWPTANRINEECPKKEEDVSPKLHPKAQDVVQMATT